MNIYWYKVLTSDLKSAYGCGVDWSEYVGHPDKRAPNISSVVICQSGYHATKHPMRRPVLGMRVFEAVVDGLPLESADDEGVWPTMGLGPERPELVPNWWHDVEAFAAELPTFPWMQPQGQPDPSWRVFPTLDAARAAVRDAMLDASWDASRDAGRDAAWAATFDATWDAGRDATRDASRDAAWVATRDAAWVATFDATRNAGRDGTVGVERGAEWDVARDASLDAALWALVLVCGGLPLAQRYIDHARARVDVWRHGYGLLSDVDGVLYVYERIRSGLEG